MYHHTRGFSGLVLRKCFNLVCKSLYFRRYFSTTNTTKAKYAKLICVSTENNNKFYEMKQINDNHFVAEWGRVGAKSTSMEIPMHQWDSKYNEKIKKGYVDQTHLTVVSSKEVVHQEDKMDFSTLSNDQKEVYELIQELQKYAKEYVEKSYKISALAVTEKQIENSQKVLEVLAKRLDSLSKTNTESEMVNIVEEMNQALIELFGILPRKMKNVKQHLISYKSPTDDRMISKDELLKQVTELIGYEQDTLDAMKTQVDILTKEKEKTDTSNAKPAPLSGIEKFNKILQSINCTIALVTDDNEIKMIKSKMDDKSYYFRKAYKVINATTQLRFDTFTQSNSNTNTTLFWHGSRNENWRSILSGGLVLRPTNSVITGKMFGMGMYFAEKFQKSLGYTSLEGSHWAGGRDKIGYLALFNVFLGKPYVVSSSIVQSKTFFYDFGEKNLKKIGNFHSVHGKKGFLLNDEFIVYNQNQCTIQYLVKVAIKGS